MKKQMYESHKIEQNSNWWFQGRKEIVDSILSRYIGKNKKLQILEIGTGYGIMTEMLKKYGIVEGIEPYKDAVDYTANTLDIKIYNGTLETYKNKKKYDVIALFDVLEHIKNDDLAIKKIHKMLNKDGLILLTVPAYKFLWSKHDDLNAHYRRYTKTQLKNKLNGFKIIKTSYFNTLLFPLALLDKLIISKNKKTPALNPKPLLNTILYKTFKTERKLLNYISFPFGVSLFVFAKKI